MVITHLSISNFRNIEGLEAVPHKKTNIIFGNNAQGKTNIIEAIWIMSGNKSFRAKQNVELINFDFNKSNVKLKFQDKYREQKVECSIASKIEYKLNSVKLSKNEMIGNFNCVVFSPTHLDLVKEGPSKRRKFLDIAISQIKPQYRDYLYQYEKVLLQRNALLKQKNITTKLLSVYDEQLAKIGTIITIYRNDYINKLQPILYSLYKDISGNKEQVDLMYGSTVFDDVGLVKTYELSHIEDYLKKLENSFAEDKRYGTTNVGVHRDDVVFGLDNVDARTYGSQGQQRSIVIALKLAEAHMLKHTTGQNPIILLDDVMSELDENRQKFILNSIEDMQVFITCCDINNTLKLECGNVFHIENGQIESLQVSQATEEV